MSDSTRLITLRQKLGLSQREMAREFGVTPGALAMWERGTRPLPGPALRIMQIYESYMDVDTQKESPAPYVRRASAAWTKHLLSLVRASSRSDAKLKTRLESAITETLDERLSRDRPKANLQLLLADKLVHSFGQAKGLPMKIAQLASYAELRLPDDVRQLLAELQTMSTPMAAGVAARVFAESIGRTPAETFAEWEPRPFAAASIGQVHRARLHSGEVVAVKIQYPEIAEAMRSDFDRLEMMQRLLSLWRQRDTQALIEVREKLLAECDYEREARHQEWFANYWQGHPKIRVPKVYREFSNKRVLTQAYSGGLTFDEFLRMSTPETRRVAALALFDFYSNNYFIAGRLHADPHPGNVLFDDDGAVTILDYGRVLEMDRADAQTYHDLIRSFMARDAAAGRIAFAKMNVVKDWKAFDFDTFWKVVLELHDHLLEDVESQMTEELCKRNLELMRNLDRVGVMESKPAFLWSNCVHLATWHIFGRLGVALNWKRETTRILDQVEPERFRERWV